MAKVKSVSISELHLDLRNYRTVRQPDEEHAINALIAIHPDWFWALMESLLDDGYSPTENIIVLNVRNSLLVREGNRRVASLKLIHGLVESVELPEHIQSRIEGLPEQWKQTNRSVPCAVYRSKDADFVDKLVSRIHAKGEASGRDKWTSVARARYARDQNQKTEPGLDLLEKYLHAGKNLTAMQAERWAGDYPLTVLDEALKRLTSLLSYNSSEQITSLYPGKHKRLLDNMLRDIGISNLGFKQLRTTSPFWGAAYGINDPNASTQTSSAKTGGAQTPATSSATTSTNKTKSRALASNDPKSVRRLLRQFAVRGTGREKVVTLLREMKTLKLEEHPHAFSFLLRSTIELSAKAYCADHRKQGGPNPKRSDGNDKPLADVLRDITRHITNNNQDKEKVKKLHGAMSELGKTNGILSVTSMNQLVHNQYFSVSPPDICTVFGNIFPLLEEMNS